MPKYIVNIIFAVVVTFSQQLIAQQGTSPVGVNFILVNFNQPPTTLTVNKAPLKYNKDFALSMQVDDGDISLFTIGYPFFEGVDGNPGLFYSDGCGNSHSFKMSSSIYVFNGDEINGPDIHTGNWPQQLTWEQMDTIYSQNWGILNHGVNGNNSSDSSFINYSIKRNRSYIRRKMYTSTDGGVITNILVNPGGNSDYTIPAFNLGNISALYTNTFSPIGNEGGDVNNDSVDWTQPHRLNRKNAATTNITNLVDGLANSSVGGANYWCPIFTHSLNNEYSAFESDFNYIANTYGINGLDNILMTTDEEIQDYLIVRDATSLNYVINGTTLLITYSGEVPENLLFYSSSIVINSDATIVSIIVDGTNDYTITGIGEANALINLNWDGYYVIPPGYLADSMVTIAVSTQNEYDCWVAMDYVITMTNGTHKDSLRQVLCAIPNVTYDAGFCNCSISLPQTEITIPPDSCIILNGAPGNYTHEWLIGDSLVDTTLNYNACPADTTLYTHIATNTLGCPAQDSILVNIDFLSLDLGPDTTICAGECVTITGPDAMAIYYWFVADTLYSLERSITPCPLDTTQYKLWVENFIGATAEDSITINVWPLPIINLQPSDTIICFGDCILLSGPTGSYTYSWWDGDMLLGTTQNYNACPEVATQYNLIITDSDGCSTEDSTMVNIDSLYFNLGPDISICLGDTATLSGPDGMDSYNWIVAGSTYATVQTIYPSPIDTTQYILQVVDSLGCTAQDTIYIIVLPLPIVNLQPSDTIICFGDCILLLGTGGNFTYSWWVGDELKGTNQNYNACPDSSTQYNLIITDLNGCTGEDSIMVNIDSLYFDLGPDISICYDDTATLEGPPYMNTYEWYIGDSLISNDSIIYPAPIVTTQYNLLVADTNSCSAEDSITINILPLPIVNIQPSDTTICFEDCIDLLGPAGNFTYSWYIGDSLYSASQNFSNCPLITTQYNLIVTDTNGCSGEDSTMVNIDSLYFYLGLDIAICMGDTAMLSGPDGMEDYNWFIADSLISSMQTILVSPVDTTQYILQVVDSIGCTAEDTIQVNVRQPPTVSFEEDSLYVCYGNDILISVVASQGVDFYTWTYNGQQWYTQSNTFNLPNPDTSNYISVQVQDPITNCQAIDSSYINVLLYPEIEVSNDTTVCSGQPVTLTVSGGSIFRWIVESDTISTDSTITVYPEMTANYIVQAAFSDSMCFSEDTVIVTVHNSATTKILYDTNVVCTYQVVKLTASGADHYLWSPSGDTSLTYEFEITDTTTIWLTGITNDGCQLTDSATFYNKPTPEVSFSGLLTVYCEGDTWSLLTGSPIDGIFYGAGMVGSKFYPQSAGPGVHDIIYTYVNTDNCIGYDTNTTTIYANGGSIDLGPDFSLPPEDSKTLYAGLGFDNYYWTTGATTQSIVVYGDEKIPGTYEYAVMGVINGCSSKGSVFITFVNPDGYEEHDIVGLTIFPNPNDGSFTIKFNSIEKNIQLNIVNLQGKLLYEKNNISCNEECKIDVQFNDLGPGIYFLRIITPKGVNTAKIILK